MNPRFELERVEALEKSEKALVRAKRLEGQRMKAGYRYVQIDSRTKVMVECDTDGEPTAKGQRTIDSMRRALLV